MEKAKIRPLATPKPLPIFPKIGRRDYVLDSTRHAKFFLRSVQGFLFPKYVILPCFLGWLVFCLFFAGFFNKATAYTPGRIFTQNTSNDVVPFGDPDDYILYLDP